MNAPIRIAVIGLGWVTLNRHIPSILRNPDFQLVGVIDRRQGIAAKTAIKYNLQYHASTESPDGLAAIEWLNNVDAVTIGTAPMFHAALTMDALALGKHVLTEKPFAMTVDEGEAMCGAALTNNRILAVMHNFQFSRAVRALEKDLSNNKLGNIRRIAATQLGNPERRLPNWFEQLPLGLFYDESPHFFYLLRRLAGGALNLQHAYGVASQNEKETPSSVNVLYRNAHDIPVTINCQFDSSISEWYVIVTGERGVGIVDIFRDIYIRLPNDRTHSLPNILYTSASAIFQHLVQHVPNGIAFLKGKLDYGNDEVFSRFAGAIRKGAPPIDISFEDALAVLKLQHEATAAIQKNMFK